MLIKILIFFLLNGIHIEGKNIFYLKDIKMENITDFPEKEIILTDNSFFYKGSPFEQFKKILLSFFNTINSPEESLEKFYVDFELLHYNVKILPDSEGVKVKERANFFGIIAGSLWIIRP